MARLALDPHRKSRRARPRHGRALRRLRSDESGQMMLLSAVVLIIAFVALTGMVARVTQLGKATSRERITPTMLAVEPMVDNVGRALTELAEKYDLTDAAEAEAHQFATLALLMHVETLMANNGYLLSYEYHCDTGDPTEWRVRLTLDDGLIQVGVFTDSFPRPVTFDYAALSSYVGETCTPAFEDVNCDGDFDIGDQIIDVADVQDGAYDTGDTDCLVITPEAGNLGEASIDFRSQGGLIIEVGLEAATGDVYLEAGGGAIMLEDVTVTSAGQTQVLTNGGALDMARTQLTASQVTFDTGGGDYRGQDAVVRGLTGPIQLLSGGGQIDLRGTTLHARQQVVVTGGAGAAAVRIDGEGGKAVSDQGAVQFTAVGGIDVDGMAFEVFGDLLIDSGGVAHAIYVEGAIFDDANDAANLEPPGAPVSGTPDFGGIE